MRITVLGGGSWGTALGHLLAAKGSHVTILVRSPEVAEDINIQHTNSRYLPDLALAPGLRATTDAASAFAGADVCILAVPCQTMRDVLTLHAQFFKPELVFVCSSKGIEIASLQGMHRVVAEVLPRHAEQYAILSGPSFAQEVITGKPTAVTLGCKSKQLGQMLQELFSSKFFRVYLHSDIVGVELGGAVKNVISIAAGVSDGLELGHGARAALITRGLAEVSRLGISQGAKAETFMGLSGMGDLVLTCTGDLSRNRQVGLRLGRGESLRDILASMRNVAEGVPTTAAVCALARKMGVELPIAEAMHRVLYDEAEPMAVVTELMARALREE